MKEEADVKEETEEEERSRKVVIGWGCNSHSKDGGGVGEG